MRQAIREAIENVGKKRRSAKGSGHVRLDGGSWFGYFWKKNANGLNTRHCRLLGYSHEINEQQARLLLAGVIKQSGITSNLTGKAGAIKARWSDTRNSSCAGSVWATNRTKDWVLCKSRDRQIRSSGNCHPGLGD